MKNRVIITGLGTAHDLDICESCNLDFSWLANNPSTILWADEICIPQNALIRQSNRNDNKADKVINLFLEKADKHNLLKPIDYKSMYSPEFSKKLLQQVQDFSDSLLSSFPNVIKEGDPGVPGEIVIEDEGYCSPWMSSIILGLNVAYDLNANCLFSPREHKFLKYLFGANSNDLGGSYINKAYNEIFSLYLPESLRIHNYAFINEDNCEQCIHHDNCRDSYISETEASLDQLLQWRQYDELYQAKDEINKIIRIKNEVSSEKDISDIVKQFQEKQAAINKNINKRFPKIKRWTKMTTVLATPVTVASAISTNIPITIGSALAVGIAQATDALLDVYESKNNWVGFVNNMKNS